MGRTGPGKASDEAGQGRIGVSNPPVRPSPFAVSASKILPSPTKEDSVTDTDQVAVVDEQEASPAPPETTQEAAPHDGEGVLARARDGFDTKTVALIKQTVAKDVSDAELGLFLELSARYQLDPFAKEIWAVKNPGRNGGGQGSVLIIVARDGLLKIANRTPGFMGIPGDVVCEKDTFRKRITETGTPVVTHEYAEGPPGSEARGEIIGAWAMALRQGRTPTYFFAPLAEYFPKSESKAKFSPWASQKSAMILKCAQSVALRQAFSITGVLGEGEEARAAEVGEAPAVADDGIPTDLPTEIVLRARADFQAARDAGIDPWRPAKVRATLLGLSDEEVQQFLGELEGRIAEAGGRVPDPETVFGDAAADAAIDSTAEEVTL